VALLGLAIVVPTAPVAAADLGAFRAASVNDWGPGQTVEQPAIEQPCGGPGQPVCPASETLSGGGGGFIPVVPERVLDAQRGGTSAAMRAGETRTVPLAGVGSVPAENVAAVALSVTASETTFLTALTVWPTGTARPTNPTVNVLPSITERAIAIVPFGSDGSVSVFNALGRTGVTIDVLGWFGGPTEFRALPATQLFSTVAGAKVTPLAAGSTTQVAVLDRGGVPASGVGAVVLHLTSALSTEPSEVTIWPAGTARPGTPSLAVQPVIARNSLVVVEPGTAGAVSVHNTAGKTQLGVEVVGWIPDTSTYRPVPATSLYAATAKTPLGAGQTAEIQVAGVGGVPSIDDDPMTEDAHSVVLGLTASPLKRPTTLTVFTTGTTRPDTTSIAASPVVAPATGLTVVPLSADGKVSLFNADASTAASVSILGWFATPMAAAQITVPETTKAAGEEDVASVDVVTNPDGQVTGATVALEPAAPDVTEGDHLVLGITDDTPEGLLGTVTDVVTNADGSQVVTTTPARLEEVFPEGDIEASLSEVSKAEAALSGVRTVAVAMNDPGTKGTKVEDPFGTHLDGIDPGGQSCSLEGVEVDFGPYVDMQFRVKWRWLSAPSVTALATLGVQASMALNDVAVTCGFQSPTLKYKSMFLVGGVPVVITFDINASLDVEAGLKGLALGASAHAWVTIGIKDNRGVADAGWDVETPSLGDLALQARHLTAYAMADAWLELKVLLYGVIGPDISVGPFLEAGASTAVSTPPVPWWAIDIGYAAKVKLVLNLWFYEWTPTLWNGEIPLADLLHLVGLISDCTGESKAFVGTKPCRAPDPGHRINGDSRDTASRIRLASATSGFDALAITGPDALTVSTAQAVDLAFDVSGRYSDDALIRVADGTTAGLGLAFGDATADGWSASGRLTGTAPAPGTYILQLEARYNEEGDTPDLALRAHRTVIVTVQPWEMFDAAAAVAAGGEHSCAVLRDGGVVCWGDNTSGQLGNNTTTSSLTAVRARGITNAVAVTVGRAHSCALLATGRVQCWGENQFGEVGNGAQFDAAVPYDVIGIATATAIGAGADHTCAVIAGGAVRCWGLNSQGQLGDGTTANQRSPVAVNGLTTATQVAAGTRHTCARVDDGTLRCWGYGAFGQLGDGSTLNRPAPTMVAGITSATTIAAGGDSSCSRLDDGTVRCWGYGAYGQLGNGSTADRWSPVAVSTITTASQVAVGSLHACARLASGAVSCWGRGADGQLGNGATADRTTPVPVSRISSATAASAGDVHSCAVLASGAVACWGGNAHGQLGDGTTTSRSIPVPALAFATVPGAPTGVTGVAGNASATIAWSPPVDTGGVPITGYTVTASSGATCTWAAGPLSCVVRGLTNGTDYTFTVTATNAKGTGDPSAASLPVRPHPVAPDRPTGVTGAAGNAQVTVSWSAPASDGGSPIIGYTATASNGRTCTWSSGPLSCAITGLTNGSSYTFTVTARNAVGTSPVSDASASVTPATVPNAPTGAKASAFDGFASVSWLAPAVDGGSPITGYTVTATPGGATCSTEGDLTCVVDGLTNGTPYTFSVAAINGMGTGAGSAASNAVTPKALAVRSVAGGRDHTCAVLTTGSMVCWGANDSGQLGNGTTTSSSVPAIVPGISTATDVAAGLGYTCAILSDKSTWCWGRNEYGQLGDGTGGEPGNRSLLPVRVRNVTNAAAVSAGARHACVVRSTGGVSCWGDNNVGQLGDNTTTTRTSPVNVAGGITAVAVAAGGNHTCSADLNGGQVRCWGANMSGELGVSDVSVPYSLVPLAVSGATGAAGVTAGHAYSCAVLSTGQVRCWGENALGQLGDSSSVSRYAPAAVDGLTTATRIASGDAHSCAVLRSGLVSCWGYAVFGPGGTKPYPIAGVTGATAVTEGAQHTCVVHGPGWLVCWGINEHGQLGNGTQTNSSTPVIVLGFPTPPTAPTGVGATAGNGHATVSWYAPESDGGSPITQYTVTAAPGGLGCATSGERGCVVAGLTNGTAYTFTVRATNAVGIGPASTPTSPVTPLATPAVDTRLVAWGDGTAGRLDLPIVGDVVAVSAGTAHTLALRHDGTVLAWGENTVGQTSVPANLTGVTAVAAGGQHSLALKGDGTVVAWGGNDDGQGTPPAGLANVTAIAAGSRHSLALTADGSVIGWGDNSRGATSVPAGMGKVKAIAAGDGFSLALGEDGTVVAWGGNGAGQATVPAELEGVVVAIAAGTSHAVALTTDSQVVAWGDDSLGQTEVSPEAWGAVAIAAGGNHTLARRIDGTVLAWGDDSAGQVDVPAGLTGVIGIAAGGTHTVVVATREQTIGFNPACPALVGRPSTAIATASSWLPVVFTATPAEVCTVNGSTGDLTLLAAGTCSVVASQPGSAIWNPALPVTRNVPVTVPDSPIYSWGDVSGCQGSVPAGIGSPVDVAAGGMHNLALAGDGHVFGWGDDQAGQATVPAGLEHVAAIDAGLVHSLALLDDGTVVAWGADDAGQGSIPAALAAELVDVQGISAGGSHNLVLLADGTVRAWGSNDDQESVVPAGLTGVTAVAAGTTHSLALRSDGTVVAWGANGSGEATVPTGLGGVVAIAAGAGYSLALLGGGTVVAWGNDSLGQATVPAGLSDVVAIAAGSGHALALRSDGSVVTWGGLNVRLAAIPTGMGRVTAIDAGEYHSVALGSE
jgi:alpha-tubulin suppressor-like RCC1 family protein